MHAALILLHAVTASIALLTGVAAFRWPGLVRVHVVGTVLMALTLGAAVWVGRERPVQLNVVFVTLLTLTVVMSCSGIRAWRCRPAPGEATSARFVAAVGFTCISLTTGLLAVAALRTGWGPAAVIAAGPFPRSWIASPLNHAIRERRSTATRPA